MKRTLLFSCLAVLAIGMAKTRTVDASTPEQALEARVRQAKPAPTAPARDWRKSAQAVQPALEALRKSESKCQEAQWSEFAGRYVVSRSAGGQLCRIYDLSFPTVMSALGKPIVARLPVQRFTAQDYLNWMDGHYDRVYRGVASHRKGFDKSASVEADWVSKLKFRSNPSMANLVGTPAGRLPASFRASDLEIGEGFKFSPTESRQLKSILATARGGGNKAAFGPTAGTDFWSEVAENPSSFLKRIRFNWNDAEKVYDVILEGDFLPINGPVALVDFSAPYKPALEMLVRNLIQTALGALTNLIPDPVTRAVVTVGVYDTFMFIDMMYTYQMNQLETTLRAGLKGELREPLESAFLERSLTLEFATVSDLMNSYIMNIATGKPFDWNQIEKVAAQARYRAEKSREISMDRLNSRLVLKSGCEVTPLAGYFVACAKRGQKQGIYSLLSESSILFWNLGAPQVYSDRMPSEILLKRQTSWLMASGLQIFKVPIPNFLVNNLITSLQTFALAGNNDEAFLRASLSLEKQRRGSLDAGSEQVLTWLYRQNLNPFLPKSEAMEAGIIAANRELLEARTANVAPTTRH